MKILFLLLLLPLTAFAGGYRTADVYSCKSNSASFEFTVGIGEVVQIKGDSIGECSGRGWVSGGDARSVFCTAKFIKDNKCQAGLAQINWSGCFAPDKRFVLKATNQNQSIDQLECVRTKKGGDWNMDGTPH